jgi:hypothetical protein
MKYLICLALLPVALFAKCPYVHENDYQSDFHLEHKRQLLIESSLNQIEHIIEKNAENIPFYDFQDLIYHISILENIY